MVTLSVRLVDELNAHFSRFVPLICLAIFAAGPDMPSLRLECVRAKEVEYFCFMDITDLSLSMISFRRTLLDSEPSAELRPQNSK